MKLVMAVALLIALCLAALPAVAAQQTAAASVPAAEAAAGFAPDLSTIENTVRGLFVVSLLQFCLVAYFAVLAFFTVHRIIFSPALIFSGPIKGTVEEAADTKPSGAKIKPKGKSPSAAAEKPEAKKRTPRKPKEGIAGEPSK